MGPDELGMDNPIEGTPLDPKRRMFLQGTAPGGLQDRMAGMDAGAPMNGPAPDAINMAANAAPTSQGQPGPGPAPAMEKPDLSHSDYSMPGGGVMGGDSGGSNGGPTLLRRNEPAPSSMSAAGGITEDNILDRVMSQNMDDTPSRNRIADLDSQIAAMHKKPSLGHRLLNIGIMAAPVIAGGIFGGEAGVSGAAQGVNAAEDTIYGRQHERELVLRHEAEAERGRQERQYERRMQMPITYMNMRMMRDYRMGMLNNSRYKTDQNVRSQLVRSGIDPETMQPIPLDQLPEKQRQWIQQSQAHEQLFNAQQGLAEARDELARAQNDPNSPVFQLAKKKYDAALEMAHAAMSRADSMGLMALTREASFNRGTYGTDNNGTVLPGTYVDPNTQQPMGWSAPGNPTANTKQRGQTANAVLPHFVDDPKNPNPAMQKGLLTLIQETPEESLGKLRGHVNEWLVGTYGIDDPALSHLRSKMLLTDSAMELSHVGAAGGIEMLNHFKSMLNMGQAKANLYINGQEMQGWLQRYSDVGTPNATAGATNPNFTPLRRQTVGETTPAASPSKPKGAASKLNKGVVEWEKGPDGKPRRKAAN